MGRMWLAASVMLLSACAGVGVMESSDPLTKLNDAESLFMEQDRPLIAERLIREAMAIYEERKDSHGLGNANREYADLLRSSSVSGKWQKFYRDNGFQDKSVTYDNRFEKAKEYYKKAVSYYEAAEQKLMTAGAYDALTNVYFNMAWSYYRIDDLAKACTAYDKTIEAYDENMRRNPTAKPYIPSGSGSFAEFIGTQKRRATC